MFNNICSCRKIPAETLSHQWKHRNRAWQRMKFLTRSLKCKRVCKTTLNQDTKMWCIVHREGFKRSSRWRRKPFNLSYSQATVVGARRRLSVRFGSEGGIFHGPPEEKTRKEQSTDVGKRKTHGSNRRTTQHQHLSHWVFNMEQSVSPPMSPNLLRAPPSDVSRSPYATTISVSGIVEAIEPGKLNLDDTASKNSTQFCRVCLNGNQKTSQCQQVPNNT